MTDLRAAAQAALEVLEWHLERGVWGADIEGRTAALRAALADHENDGKSNCTTSQRMNPHFTNTSNPVDFPKSKYTAPLRRAWQGLTDEEMCAGV